MTQIELLGEPPAVAARRPHAVAALADEAAPRYALKEGGERDFAISTTKLTGNGRVEQIHWVQNSGKPPFDAIPGTEESHPADLVLLAMGFLHPEQPLLERARRREGPARQRQGRRLRDLGRRRVRGRRRAPRPVADRVGDQRGPPVRSTSSAAAGTTARRPVRLAFVARGSSTSSAAGVGGGSRFPARGRVGPPRLTGPAGGGERSSSPDHQSTGLDSLDQRGKAAPGSVRHDANGGRPDAHAGATTRPRKDEHMRPRTSAAAAPPSLRSSSPRRPHGDREPRRRPRHHPGGRLRQPSTATSPPSPTAPTITLAAASYPGRT